MQSITWEYLYWHTQNTQINKGKLYSKGQFTLLSKLGRAPEEGLSKEGNAHEEYCWPYWVISKEEAQEGEGVDLEGKDIKDGQEAKA